MPDGAWGNRPRFPQSGVRGRSAPEEVPSGLGAKRPAKHQVRGVAITAPQASIIPQRIIQPLLALGQRLRGGLWVPIGTWTFNAGAGSIQLAASTSTTGKVCADAIIRAFNGLDPDPAPTTNSACYSPISSTVASWLTASYRYDSVSHTMKRVDESFGEAAGPSAENFHEMFHWADNIFADAFG